MSYLHINLARNGQQIQLNPDEAIIRLQQQFPEAIVLPGDQLTLQAQRAEHLLAKDEPGTEGVLKKLWWDVENSGPAYAFYIPNDNGPRIDGVIKRYQADFHGDGDLADTMRTRIVSFLRSLIPQGAVVDVCEEHDQQKETVSLPDAEVDRCTVT